jgi:hypothetical protein
MVFRPSAADASRIASTRELVRRSREILAASYRALFASRREPGASPPPTHGAVTQAEAATVAAFLCPETNLMVQHWMDGRAIVREDEYEAVTCPACAKLHFMNRMTHKLLAYDK